MCVWGKSSRRSDARAVCSKGKKSLAAENFSAVLKRLLLCRELHEVWAIFMPLKSACLSFIFLNVFKTKRVNRPRPSKMEDLPELAFEKLPRPEGLFLIFLRNFFNIQSLKIDVTHHRLLDQLPLCCSPRKLQIIFYQPVGDRELSFLLEFKYLADVLSFTGINLNFVRSTLEKWKFIKDFLFACPIEDRFVQAIISVCTTSRQFKLYIFEEREKFVHFKFSGMVGKYFSEYSGG